MIISFQFFKTKLGIKWKLEGGGVESILNSELCPLIHSTSVLLKKSKYLLKEIDSFPPTT